MLRIVHLCVHGVWLYFSDVITGWRQFDDFSPQGMSLSAES